MNTNNIRCKSCNTECWAAGKEYAGECWGEVRPSEDYPDCWSHFCEDMATMKMDKSTSQNP